MNRKQKKNLIRIIIAAVLIIALKITDHFLPEFTDMKVLRLVLYLIPYANMEKRGSRYLRYELFNAAQYVCIWDPTFKAYLAKKRGEGKHYFVAISHACKKLVRVIYRMQLTGEPYRTA